MKKKIFLLFALLCAVAQGAWADEVKTVLDDGVFTGFTATSGSNTGDGGYDKLVDGNTSTKWCTNSSPFYVEFHSSGLIVPKGYIMTTGGDTQKYSGRNPKSWTIKAKANANDSWTTLVTVTDDTTMPAANTTPVDFTISGNTTAYRYFRLDVSATRGDSWFQLSEFQFVGTTTDTDNITVNPSLSGFGTSESPYTIGSTADWNLFASKVNSGTNNYSGKFVQLTADIEAGAAVGLRGDKPFSGTFLGNGHTITANISSTTTGTGANEQGVAPFHYIKNATIKNLTVGGTIASASYHTAGLVGFADGTNLIEGCAVTATLNINSNYAGGIIGHGMSSTTTIKGCVFAGTINGVGGNRSNFGGIWGWSTSGTPTLEYCLEAGTYTGIASMHPMGLQGGSGTITDCYYVNPQVGSPSNACTVSGAAQVYTAAPSGELTKWMTLQDGNTYYALCAVSGVKSNYLYTGSAITVTPTVICGSTTLAEGTDYTSATSPATVQEKGDYTLTFTGQGNYTGAKTIQFAVIDINDKIPVTSETTTLEDFAFAVNQDVTISSRITISGNVTLYLGEGTTLTAPKGIELSQGNSLTINGPGALTINGCDYNKSGIGAASVGTLVINGGTINVTGGQYGAGIGGDIHNSNGGNIYINGGIINVTGGRYGAGIGGGYDDQYRQHTFCGNIYINGGQVTATAGEKACGIGPGYSKQFIDMGNDYVYEDRGYSSGSLTLSWTSVDNDFVNINRFNEDNGGKISSITIADGKQFVIGETTIDSNTTDLINMLNGKIIWPYGQGGDFVLTDGNTYIRTGSIPVNSATYTKTTDRVGKFHSWLVPFDHTIKAADLEKFKFYKINMIANAPNPQTNASDEMWVFLKQLGEGDMLHANMPYVYKPLKAVTDYTFTTNNAVLKAKNTGVIADASTLEDIYSFYATYAPTTATAQDPFYYVNIDGGISLGNDGTVSVGAFRWILRVESKYGTANPQAAYARQIRFFDGEDSDVMGVNEVIGVNEVNDDSWYSLDGRKLNGKPAKSGIYVVNGRKVVIK